MNNPGSYYSDWPIMIAVWRGFSSSTEDSSGTHWVQFNSQREHGKTQIFRQKPRYRKLGENTFVLKSDAKIQLCEANPVSFEIE